MGRREDSHLCVRESLSDDGVLCWARSNDDV